MPNSNDVIEAPKRIQLMSTKDIKHYWTEEKKSHATPIEIPLLNEQPSKMNITSNMTEANKEPVFQSMTLPDENIKTANDVLYHSGSVNYHTEKVENILNFPYCAVGKLFMTFPKGDFVGTAWVIGESVIFTAGHCVYMKELGGWASNIIFSTNDGIRDNSDFIAETYHILEGWKNNQSDYKYDLAVCTMQSPVRPKTGSLGWIAHIPFAEGIYESIGYPADDDKIKEFDGKYMWRSIGKSFKDTRHNPNEVFGMHNNMTGGCSGGPWLTSYNSNIYANGINSFGYTNDHEKMYTPYFGEGFLNLIDKVKSNMKAEEKELIHV